MLVVTWPYARSKRGYCSKGAFEGCLWDSECKDNSWIIRSDKADALVADGDEVALVEVANGLLKDLF